MKTNRWLLILAFGLTTVFLGLVGFLSKGPLTKRDLTYRSSRGSSCGYLSVSAATPVSKRWTAAQERL